MVYSLFIWDTKVDYPDLSQTLSNKNREQKYKAPKGPASTFPLYLFMFVENLQIHSIQSTKLSCERFWIFRPPSCGPCPCTARPRSRLCCTATPQSREAENKISKIKPRGIVVVMHVTVTKGSGVIWVELSQVSNLSLNETIVIRYNSVWRANQLVGIHNVAAHKELFEIYNQPTSRKRIKYH